MPNVTWILHNDLVNQKIWSDVFGAVLVNGTILPGAITTQFHLQDGKNLATFQGNFIVNGGVVQSGTITGFDLYFDGPGGQVLDATGYAIDFVTFKQALAAFQSSSSPALLDLFFGDPMTVHGTAGGEVILGGDAADTLHGNGAGDKINGDDGDDQIFGGDGDDFLSGGMGDDTLRGGAGKDFLGGNEGSDTGDYSGEANSVSVALGGPDTVELLIGGAAADILTGVENIVGGSGNDGLVGDGFNNTLVGNAGDDALVGQGGNDQLSGGDDKDKLKGGNGNDDIAGGLGNDVLIGGKNSDTLIFDAALNGKTNTDKVKKFSHAKDTFELDQTVFTALDPGALKGKHFRIGNVAKDGSDHIIYNDESGALSYDSDGQGGAKKILFAVLKGAPNVAADDFVIV